MKTMKKRFLILLLAFALVLAALPVTTVSAASFYDVPRDAWYAVYINQITRVPGIIDGYSDGSFKPDDPVKRGEFLKMICEAEDASGPSTITSDKSRDNIHWAGKYYSRAVEYNLLVSDVYAGDVLFPCTWAELEQPISRYEMAVIVNNILTNVAMDSTVTVAGAENYITDYYDVPDIFINAVEQVCGKKLMEGDEFGCFNGHNNLRRCEAATVIYRFLFEYNIKGENLAPYAKRPKVSLGSSAPKDFVSFATRYQSMTDAERRTALFGNPNKTYFTSAQDAAGYMTTVTIPIWTMDKTGNKFESSMAVTVHNLVADEIRYIFEEIYNDPERFPIYGGWSVGGSRYTDTMRHAWGCAVDVNAFYNCECTTYWNSGITNVTCGYGWWPQGTNWSSFAGSMSAPSAYSISADSSVVRAFAKYGWGWGGQGYTLYSDGRQKFDFMHFSILPSGG